MTIAKNFIKILSGDSVNKTTKHSGLNVSNGSNEIVVRVGITNPGIQDS